MSSELLAQALASAGAEIGDKATGLIVSNLRLQIAEAQLAQALEHNALQSARIAEDAETIRVVRADRDQWRTVAEGLRAQSADSKRRKKL